MSQPDSLSQWLRDAMAAHQPRLSIRMLQAGSRVPRSVLGSTLRHETYRPNGQNLGRLAAYFDVDVTLLWRLSWGRSSADSHSGDRTELRVQSPLSAEERVLASLSPEVRVWVTDLVDRAEGLDGTGRLSVIRVLARVRSNATSATHRRTVV